MAQLFQIRDGAVTVGAFFVIATLAGCTSRVEKLAAEGQPDALKKVEVPKVAEEQGDDSAHEPLNASMATNPARAPDRFPQEVIEFFRQRDQWLVNEAVREMSNSSAHAKTPIQDELRKAEAELATKKELLKGTEG